VLDCKNENCQKELINAPKITDNLCESCQADFNRLKELLDKSDINYRVNKSLVRGLDYYNKTAFEFISDEIGAQSSIAGGGRYDNLVEYLGGKSTPAVGFAIGVERVLDLVELPNNKREGYYFGVMESSALDTILNLAKNVRANTKAFVEYEKKKLKAHLKNADRFNAKYCCVIGEDELQNGTIWVKDLEAKKEEVINLEKFIKSIA
jgi:histidyl-tRNA synthetase